MKQGLLLQTVLQPQRTQQAARRFVAHTRPLFPPPVLHRGLPGRQRHELHRPAAVRLHAGAGGGCGSSCHTHTTSGFERAAAGSCPWSQVKGWRDKAAALVSHILLDLYSPLLRPSLATTRSRSWRTAPCGAPTTRRAPRTSTPRCAAVLHVQTYGTFMLQYRGIRSRHRKQRECGIAQSRGAVNNPANH